VEGVDSQPEKKIANKNSNHKNDDFEVRYEFMSEGKLFVVATPIGNLGDMVPRAVECLQSVDIIAAEDTRRTGLLCSHFDIRTKLKAYHDHNEERFASELVAQIQNGKTVALVSDAGMPLVSDPGFRLVQAARKAGVDVTVIPGACALVTALAGAGLASDKFIFMGFPPAKDKARIDWLEAEKQQIATLIFYESSHRIEASLQSMQAVFGDDRQICLARELTKTYETWLYGTLHKVSQQVAADANQRKGEFVVVVEGASDKLSVDDAHIARYMTVLMADLPIKRAAALTAELLGLRKKQCYQVGLTLNKT